MNNYANSRWKERGSFSKDILHSYQDIIDAIRTAPYGFDTREAMAQMLMFLYGTVQSIGDNFSIDMSPTDTFENVAKLKEKYPNGQQGVFVVQILVIGTFGQNLMKFGKMVEFTKVKVMLKFKECELQTTQ